MTGVEPMIIASLIGAGGAAISTFGLPEGTDVEGFGRESLVGVFNDVNEAVRAELANARALRDQPISIPTVPGFAGISGDLRVAGLPSGTVGLFPNVEEVAGAPITFGAVPGIPGEGGEAGPPPPPPGGRPPGNGDGNGNGGGPGPLPAAAATPFGGAEEFGLVFGTQQDRQSALDQIAMTIKKLTEFQSQVGAKGVGGGWLRPLESSSSTAVRAWIARPKALISVLVMQIGCSRCQPRPRLHKMTRPTQILVILSGHAH